MNAINLKESNYSDISNLIRHELDNVGYILLKGLDIDLNNTVSCEDTFINFCLNIGRPQPHNNASIVWHIKNNPQSKSELKTYSEHNEEAPFHTDSQYREFPENYFALLVVKKAKCGGGKTSILSLKSIYKLLSRTPNGRKVIEILSENEVPFAVPSVFSLSGKQEVIFSKILQGNKIRFRHDTLMKGLEICPKYAEMKLLNAIDFFYKTIKDNSEIIEVLLEESEMLFINNETMLHKRTCFSDNDRHLLRIRLIK